MLLGEETTSWLTEKGREKAKQEINTIDCSTAYRTADLSILISQEREALAMTQSFKFKFMYAALGNQFRQSVPINRKNHRLGLQLSELSSTAQRCELLV